MTAAAIRQGISQNVVQFVEAIAPVSSVVEFQARNSPAVVINTATDLLYGILNPAIRVASHA